MPSSKGYIDLETGAVGGINAILNEAIGTCFLAFALFGATGGLDKNLAVGGMVSFFCWWEADGHYNPAVTVASMVGSSPSSSIRSGLLAILGQVAGAAVATLVSSQLMSSSVSSDGAGDLSAGLTDALLTLIVIMTWKSSTSGLDKGLVYFASLSALASQFGANASIVLGVVLANAATGGSLDLGMGTIVAVGAPLATAALSPVLLNLMSEVLPKLTNGINKAMMPELLGTFFFGLLYFSICSSDDALAPLAVGVALLTAHTLVPTADLNPTVTIAKWVKAKKFVDWFDPILIVLSQTVGVLLAAIVGSFVGISAAVPEASSLGSSAALEAVFAFVLSVLYLSFGGKANTTVAALGYFASISSFDSSFNPALHLGTVVGGMIGFGGGGSLAVTTALVPLAAAVIAGIVYGTTDANVNEAIGAFVVLVTLASGSATPALTLGAMVAALSTAYKGGTFNPALLVPSMSSNLAKIFFQIAGSVAGGLFALWAGLTAEFSSPGLLTSPVAEFLLVAVLMRVYGIGGESAGLAYFALLAIFSVAAGSIGNPATVLGVYVANGMLGSGFDFGTDELIAMLSHVIAPMVGGLCSAMLFSVLTRELCFDLFNKAGLSVTEFVGSFLIVLSASGVSDDLAYSVAVMLVIHMVFSSDRADLFPAISAYRLFGEGVDVLGFVKKLLIQTLGALAAGAVSAWLLGGTIGGVDDESVSSAALYGTLWGLTLGWLYKYAPGDLGFAVGFFALATTFGAYNGASLLGGAILSADVSSLTSPVWLASFLAPLFGGVLSARLPALVGK
jgi:glycerol uptake facilitator-like aquaporin